MTPDQINEIRANPYKEDFPLLSRNTDLAFLDSAATAQRPNCVLEAQRSFYETMSRQLKQSMRRGLLLRRLLERPNHKILCSAAIPVKL
mgnify:CR=1 FL=1